jgi:iron complex transport system ATP-binding protein
LALRVRELSAHAGTKRLVESVSFELAAGELCILLGANGAGKSTLLRALLGDPPPEPGRVMLLGQDLTSYRPVDRARAVTLVPQEQPVDFPLRVGELVELGRLPHSGAGSSAAADRAAVESALERTDLVELRERDVATLSGGERQRASLARALAQCTPVLLLDEPTAHLDITHQIAMLELVRRLTSTGGAALCALHDLGLAARFADRLLLLENGRLTASGPPWEVLTSERLALAFGVRAAIEHDDHGRIRHLTVLGRAVPPGRRQS